jgi:cellobiose-specific phosphotransferase system component IIB
MMVCTGCGKEISMMTYGEMRMKKILEAAEKMKNK